MKLTLGSKVKSTVMEHPFEGVIVASYVFMSQASCYYLIESTSNSSWYYTKPFSTYDYSFQFLPGYDLAKCNDLRRKGLLADLEEKSLEVLERVEEVDNDIYSLLESLP